MNGPASSSLVSYTVTIPRATDGTAGSFEGWGTAWDDAVVSNGVEAANTTYLARIHGIVNTGANGGTLAPKFRAEAATTAVKVMTNSWGSLYTP
jgi:hypothetical protein